MMMGATLMLTCGGRPVALIYPASKSNDAGNLALFCLRYLGAVSSSHHYWRVSLRSVYPTEAGAVAAYALFVATVIYREMTFATLWHVLIGAAKTTSVVMFLVASAQVSAADYHC